MHLESNVMKHVKLHDKEEIVYLNDLFQTSRSDGSVSKGWQRWTEFIHRYSKISGIRKHAKKTDINCSTHI